MSEPARPLFDLGAYHRGSTSAERLKALVLRAGRTETRRRARSREREDAEVIDRLHAMGLELAVRFRLSWKVLEAEREGVNGHYGICWQDGTIRIRLRHAKTGRLLKESSLVDTLCHELAHLRHFDHSERFRLFYLRILEEARRLGYYRPGPSEQPEGRRQRALFGDWACTLHGAAHEKAGAR